MMPGDVSERGGLLSGYVAKLNLRSKFCYDKELRGRVLRSGLVHVSEIQPIK